MNIEIDTHSHTIASGHAYNTIREMCLMAKEKGLKGLAITEHGPDMPGAPHMYYFQNLKVVPRVYCGIRLNLGVELNIRNRKGEVDLSDRILEKMDIGIASIHTVCFQDEPSVENVTEAYINAMKNPLVDIIGHPDDSRFPVDYERLVDAAKRTGTLLEINNSSLASYSFRENADKNVRTMLELCKKENVMVVMASDAHVDVRVGEKEYSEKIMEESCFPETLIANVTYTRLMNAIKRNKKSWTLES